MGALSLYLNFINLFMLMLRLAVSALRAGSGHSITTHYASALLWASPRCN
jgi:hypothetical protein